ncbi:tripartite tricarboxylate transporter substrate binding protein [Sediminicoccus sp. KRV36]|uniref:Bug family tripartite tricarboxylate transporter substrate binding protein n=1 Tax=Sediminicoccus sp. KRV36 TaxID=3133721 RepID=UPI00200EA6E4|nr:tripartite tricarboxylate transporter substrate binding protein [Sediminicoccus rosea]UPY35872.1 tripartite tricarboxylate transporter substrate binding protein [Sediminicoccus rosea]
MTRRALLSWLAASPALAAGPEGPITLLIPFAAGGATDVLARLIAPALAQRLGAEVVIENMAGESGQRAIGQLTHAAPDGRTLLIGNLGTFAFNPHLFERLAYDPLVDLNPIGLIGTNPMVLLASRVSGITDVAGLRRLAREGRLSIGSAGRGSALHMGGVMLMRALGDGGELVTYPGGGPALEDLQAGLLDIMVDQAITAIPATHLGARAIAVLGPQRLPEIATVPTAAEIGLAMPELAIWNMLAAPAGTAAPIIATLAQALEGALEDEMVARRLATDSVITPEGAERGPVAAAALIRAEHARWGAFIHAARMERGG